MKKILLFILFSQITNCQSEDLSYFEEIKVENLEFGKCYFTKRLKNSEKKNIVHKKYFILEIKEPVFKKIKVKHSVKELKLKIKDKNYISLQTKKSYKRIEILESNLDEIDNINNKNTFTFCIVEHPEEWITIKNEVLKEDSIEVIEFKLIEKSKLIKKYVETIPKALNHKQYFFEGGSWSVPIELNVSSCNGAGGSQLIRRIQEKLILKAYELEVNNIMDEKTKKALIDFQKNNNLKENSLNKETLKKLGIKY